MKGFPALWTGAKCTWVGASRRYQVRHPFKEVTRHAGVEVLQVRTEQLFICAYALRQVLLK